eukprot:TRINITY_DN11134_c0_g1_i1.p1 TRINITY_DN11134_c0_g1~~TRINITY_DN11134_c0_g1_i1.p1  ORF type:complete len:696 (+),score=127.96 TRINITY_DN11134_c0_g1_i1:154-2241(+)
MADEFGLPPKRNSAALYKAAPSGTAATIAHSFKRKNPADFVRSSYGIDQQHQLPDNQPDEQDDDDDDFDFDALDEIEQMASIDVDAVEHASQAKVEVASDRQPSSSQQTATTIKVAVSSNEVHELRGKIKILEARLEQEAKERSATIAQATVNLETRLKHEVAARKESEEKVVKFEAELNFAKAQTTTEVNLEKKYKKLKQEHQALLAKPQAALPTRPVRSPSNSTRSKRSSSRKSSSNKPDWNAFDQAPTPVRKRVKSMAVQATPSPTASATKRAQSAPAAATPTSTANVYTIKLSDGLSAGADRQQLKHCLPQMYSKLAHLKGRCGLDDHPSDIPRQVLDHRIDRLPGVIAILDHFQQAIDGMAQHVGLVKRAPTICNLSKSTGISSITQAQALLLITEMVASSVTARAAFLGWTLTLDGNDDVVTLYQPVRQYKLARRLPRFQRIWTSFNTMASKDPLLRLTTLRLWTALVDPCRALPDESQASWLDHSVSCMLEPLATALQEGHREPLVFLSVALCHQQVRQMLNPLQARAAEMIDNIIHIAFSVDSGESGLALTVLNTYAFHAGGYCHGLGAVACAKLLSQGLFALDDKLLAGLQQSQHALAAVLSQPKVVAVVYLLQRLPYDNINMLQALDTLDRIVKIPCKLISLKQAINTLDEHVQAHPDPVLNDQISSLVDIHDAILQAMTLLAGQ